MPAMVLNALTKLRGTWIAAMAVTAALLTASGAWAQPAAESPRVRVVAVGQAAADLPNAREAAVEDALRRCVEAGGGVSLASASQTSEFVLVADAIYTRTEGFIESYEIVAENRNQDGLWTVRVEAIVSRGDIDANVEAFKALLRRKGHPRLMVMGTTDGQPFDLRLTVEIQSLLERRNIRVIDLSRYTDIQRRDAEEAARESDAEKASRILKQMGADYLVVVQVEGEHLPVELNHGVEWHRADAVAITRIIEADSAQVLGSKVVEVREGADQPEKAGRRATQVATIQAIESALSRVAANWLTDVDQRQGQQITIVMHNYDFNRLTRLVEIMRGVRGIEDVTIKAADAQGLSEVVITTHHTAPNVAMALTRMDKTLKVRSASPTRIDVD